MFIACEGWVSYEKQHAPPPPYSSTFGLITPITDCVVCTNKYTSVCLLVTKFESTFEEALLSDEQAPPAIWSGGCCCALGSQSTRR